MSTKAVKLPSGNWRVNQYIGKDKQGKRQYKSFTASSKKEAEYLAADYLLNVKEPMNISFGKATDEYIAMKSNVLSPSTILGYKKIKKNYLYSFEKKMIDTITQTDVQKLINELTISHSAKTVRNAYALLASVMKVYRPSFYFHVTLPQREKREIFIPTKTMIKELLYLVQGTRLELPFLLASQCGLRASEIIALKKDCIDIDNELIKIKKAMIMGENGAVVKQPKSYAGYREIPCSRYICELAMASDADPIVKMSGAQISKEWGRFLKKNDIPHFNFHALRHYYASQAMLLNIPQRYIAELMGHSSTKLLETIYQHTFPDAKREYADRLNGTLSEIIQHEIQHEKIISH